MSGMVVHIFPPLGRFTKVAVFEAMLLLSLLSLLTLMTLILRPTAAAVSSSERTMRRGQRETHPAAHTHTHRSALKHGQIKV